MNKIISCILLTSLTCFAQYSFEFPKELGKKFQKESYLISGELLKNHSKIGQCYVRIENTSETTFHLETIEPTKTTTYKNILSYKYDSDLRKYQITYEDNLDYQYYDLKTNERSFVVTNNKRLKTSNATDSYILNFNGLYLSSIENKEWLCSFPLKEYGKPFDIDHSGFVRLLKPQEMNVLSFDMVDHAKSEILAAYFIMSSYFGKWDDQSSKIFFAKLMDAASRGVKVKVLLDGTLIKWMDHQVFRAMQSLGIQIKIFHPFMNQKFANRIRDRLHDKILVVDDNLVVGSSNIWDYSFQPGHLMEADLLISGAAVGEARAHFYQFWDSKEVVTSEFGGKKDPSKNFLKEYWSNHAPSDPLVTKDTFVLAPKVRYVHDTPEKTPKVGTAEEVVDLISGAKKSIIIVNPYVILVPKIKQILEKVSQQGVKVKLFTNSRKTHEVGLIYDAYSKDMPYFMKNKFEIWEYQGPDYTHMHGKYVIVDETKIFLGSFNFDPVAYSRNTEMGVVIDESTDAHYLVDFLKQDMAYIQKNSLKVLDQGKPTDDFKRCVAEGCSLWNKILRALARNFL